MASKQRKAKQEETQEAPGKFALSIGFFLSGALVAILAFISLQAAAMALGFMALATFVLFDSNQRRYWEQKINLKIKIMGANHDKLAEEVEAQRQNIIDVRGELDEVVINSRSNYGERRELLVDEARPTRPAAANAPAPKTVYRDTVIDQSALNDAAIRDLVHNAVRNKRIDVFVQPVVRLPQRKTRFYELFARIRAKPGVYLPAARYMPMAYKESLMNEIDHLLLMQCLKIVKSTQHVDRAAPFFLNITTATLANVAFMKQLLNFLAANRTLAPRLIFEIRQKDYAKMNPRILEILHGLGKLGCSLSMDHVESLDFDLKFMQMLKVRFVKINAKTLIEKTRSDKEFLTVMKAKKQLEGNGIGFIVEKVENEYALKELLDYDINYGQGFLFGKPDLQAAYKQRAAGAAA